MDEDRWERMDRVAEALGVEPAYLFGLSAAELSALDPAWIQVLENSSPDADQAQAA